MNCSELKDGQILVGQILVCERCGLEFKVIKECKGDSCTIGCVGDIDCCGEPMKLKE